MTEEEKMERRSRPEAVSRYSEIARIIQKGCPTMKGRPVWLKYLLTNFLKERSDHVLCDRIEHFEKFVSELEVSEVEFSLAMRHIYYDDEMRISLCRLAGISSYGQDSEESLCKERPFSVLWRLRERVSGHPNRINVLRSMIASAYMVQDVSAFRLRILTKWFVQHKKTYERETAVLRHKDAFISISKKIQERTVSEG